MNIFFIDFENVGLKGFEGIEKLSEEDEVLVFYGKLSTHYSLKEELKKRNPKVKIKYFEIFTGSDNALDFQLTAFLGEEIEKHKLKNDNIWYYVVSKDNGFDVLEKFYRERDIEVITVDNLAKQTKFNC